MTTKAKRYICRRKIKHEKPQQQQQQNVKYNKKTMHTTEKSLYKVIYVCNNNSSNYNERYLVNRVLVR